MEQTKMQPFIVLNFYFLFLKILINVYLAFQMNSGIYQIIQTIIYIYSNGFVECIKI